VTNSLVNNVTNLTLKWLKNLGGVAAIAKRNREKAKIHVGERVPIISSTISSTRWPCSPR
jgi:hypothetical protein